MQSPNVIRNKMDLNNQYAQHDYYENLSNLPQQLKDPNLPQKILQSPIIPSTQDQYQLQLNSFNNQGNWMKLHETHEINQRISSEDIRRIYNVGKEIGHGRYGTVRLAQKNSHPKKRFAVKSISRDKIKTDIHLLEQELEILKSADHPNIINFYEIYKDQTHFHIVTEFCEGGELFEHIMDKGTLSEQEAAIIVLKIVSAIRHLHEKNICHRDLKPENVLFEVKGKRQEIKVIDFGLSKYFNDDHQMTTKIGTPYYVSPEILEGKYDNSCDIWSVGVITYIMLCGYPPFNAQNENVLFKKIMECDYTFLEDDWESISKEAKDFVSQCLVLDTTKRLTAEMAINHPWLQKHSKECLQKNISNEVLIRLKNFKRPSTLQAEVLRVLGTLLTYKEIMEIKDTFYALDDNLSGGITYEELREAFYEHQAFTEGKDKELELREIFYTTDFNSNDQITFSEFLMATLDPQTHLTRENIKNVFKYFDADDCDYITASGLKKVFLRSGRSVTDEEIENIFNEINMQVNEKISLDKFMELFEVRDQGEGTNKISPVTSTASRSLRNSFRDDLE
eukprot:403333852